MSEFKVTQVVNEESDFEVTVIDTVVSDEGSNEAVQVIIAPKDRTHETIVVHVYKDPHDVQIESRPAEPPIEFVES